MLMQATVAHKIAIEPPAANEVTSMQVSMAAGREITS